MKEEGEQDGYSVHDLTNKRLLQNIINYSTNLDEGSSVTPYYSVQTRS